MRFVQISITPEIFNAALARATNLPEYKLNFKQYLQTTNGELQAKLEGAIGEVVVEKWLKANNINFQDDRANPHHDYTLEHGLTLEIKTKVRTVTPTPDYECSIPEYTINMQTAKVYIFVSLTQIKDIKLSLEKYPEAYIVGVISKKKFVQAARYWEKGKIDPSNNYPIKISCFNVFIHEMTNPDEFPEAYRKYISRCNYNAPNNVHNLD